MFAGKDSDQLGVLVQGAEILLVVDLGAIRVQMDCRLLLAFLKFLGHFCANLLQARGAHGFLNVACNVLDLQRKQTYKNRGKREFLTVTRLQLQLHGAIHIV